MTRDDFKIIIDLIRSGNHINPNSLEKHFKGSLEWLEKETSWLDHLAPRFKDRVMAILLDEYEVSKCKHCGGDSVISSRTDRMKESIFTRYCSKLCSVHGSKSYLIASRTHYPNPKNSKYKT